MKIAISQCPNYSLTSAWLLRVCNIQCSSHSDQCWHRNAITPADRIIVPHTADCMPTFLPALVLQRCMLSPSDFHQSQMLNWCSHYLYTRVAAVSRVSAVQCPWLTAKERGKCLWSRLWECGWSVTDALLQRHNYRTMPSVRLSPISLRQTSSPGARPCTWLGDYASSLWRLWEKGMLIISVSELLEIAVQIIENKKIIPFQPKNHVWIIREVEVLEWIWYIILAKNNEHRLTVIVHQRTYILFVRTKVIIIHWHHIHLLLTASANIYHILGLLSYHGYWLKYTKNKNASTNFSSPEGRQKHRTLSV